MSASVRFTLSLLVMAACGTSASPVAGAGPTAPQAAAAQQAPAHVFTARPHPARRYDPPPRPELSGLPALVDRSRQCFGPDASEGWGRGVAPPPRRRSPKKKQRKNRKKARGPGYVPYDSGAAAGGVLGGSSGGVLGSGRATSAGTAKPRPQSKRAAPPPPKTSAPVPDPEPQSAEAPPQERFDLSKDEMQGNMGASRNLDDSEALARAVEVDAEYRDWGASTYLSNDDTMSLSSAQRVIYAIDNFLPLPAEHIRPHEMLNYFSFDTAPVLETNDFSVHATIAPKPDKDGSYTLAMAVRGRPMGVDSRRNANLAYVIDRSGSMANEGRMEYLKRGLTRSLGQLKRGDIVHLVLFDDRVCTPIENFVLGRDPPQLLERAIGRLQPRGATDLQAGLAAGYAIADRAYQGRYTNRVVMVTDARTNSGVTDAELIATVGRFYDRRQIRLSGVGVGADFNDALLDRLTERGRGAYVFLGSAAEVDAVFGPRFVSLIETTAVDVHFQLHLPPSLRMDVFYGEESSTVKEDVQAIHYFANTSQLFLSDVMARQGVLREQDSIMLTIEYDEPDSGEARIEEYAFNLGEMRADSRNVDKGRLVIQFVDGLAWMAARPSGRGFGRGGWEDEQAWGSCEQGRADLDRLSQSISDDPEVRRILSLWDKHCARYSRPRRPQHRPAAADTWPSAAH